MPSCCHDRGWSAGRLNQCHPSPSFGRGCSLGCSSGCRMQFPHILSWATIIPVYACFVAVFTRLLCNSSRSFLGIWSLSRTSRLRRRGTVALTPIASTCVVWCTFHDPAAISSSYNKWGVVRHLRLMHRRRIPCP
eukprot:5904276-Pyramimonas_sp.AAC.1